jgi:ubiquinone/menaquinone biosynthesis C-methylase UbiE
MERLKELEKLFDVSIGRPPAGADSSFSAAFARRAPRRRALQKDWDRYVAHADQLARTPGFQGLRDRILEKAAPGSGDRALDVGTGTGLLALPLSRQASWVWAVDISPAMVECVRARASQRGLGNVGPVVASATELPLEDASVDVAVSNYCFHHLDRAGKRAAISELYRVLSPGGRLVFGDMMFGWRPTNQRDRGIVAAKARAMARRGPSGLVRLARNALRVVTFSGERPAPTEWWRRALLEGGFVDVAVEQLPHEGGVAIARRPR